MTFPDKFLLALLSPALCLGAWCAEPTPTPLLDQVPGVNRTAIPKAHTERDLSGWSVRIDDRLLKGEAAQIGERAVQLLNAKLIAIAVVVPDKQLADLRKVRIQLDLDYAGLRSMQYHPSAEWLKSQGYSEALAKCVHIPEVAGLLSPFENRRMPWVILHELVHAYHDQVLGYDEPRILAAWKKFKDSGKYTSVLTSMGPKREHYGLTNHKEFFAEMSESYLGSNDFFPFVAGDLKQVEPEIFALMSDIWGPMPEPHQRQDNKTK